MKLLFVIVMYFAKYIMLNEITIRDSNVFYIVQKYLIIIYTIHKIDSIVFYWLNLLTNNYSSSLLKTHN